MKRADTARARAHARDILTDAGVRAAPVPVEKIIRARGIVVQHAPLADDLSGMAYIREGIGIVGVNALHHPNRQRFTLAHEFAHHELHADILKAEVHVDRGFRVLKRDQLASEGVDWREIEANAFAAELLMPQFLLDTMMDVGGFDLEDDERVEALARRFRVSASALRFRLLA
ncbi:ImmA/IrrE family metallo-endopeptidase [Brevundimonas naejangsanensis]|uniref:ImmA/IrrE family metallo-endopeptidase n=1 Tax=Brevundimonas naejangsanensis TaxID=588932 RepID=A0A494RGC9_9CAUL|nr:ImmA/IrrE family metallo-endopeptidase [Brevundimonas naejangsanensis]AYG94499.1 ImmA/IrrE family metallo-endopeptidase [Brevundimonas naejangsanensis]